MDSIERQRVQALSRGLRILSCFDTRKACWTVGELSRDLNLNRGTVHRYVKTLESEGFLAMDPATGKYHVGFRAYQLGKVSNLQAELVRLAHPHMEALAYSSLETVGLGTWVGDGVMFLDLAVGPGPFEPRVLTGQVYRDFDNAHAKVYLAFMPESRREELLLQAREGSGAVQPADFEKLVAELQQVKSDGIAYGIGPAIQGVCVMATPVYDAGCEVRLTMSIIIPSERFSAVDTLGYATLLKRHAAALSDDLGFKGQSSDGTRISVEPCRTNLREGSCIEDRLP